MDFFNKLGESLQNAGKEVTKKTKDLGGVVSLSAQIKEGENQLEKVYAMIGKKYSEAFPEELRERFFEEYEQITKISSKLEEDKEQLRVLKGLKVCPNCGAQTDVNALHCPMCGTELKQKEETVEEVAEVQEQNCCPYCKEPVSENAKFCAKCGTKINQ